MFIRIIPQVSCQNAIGIFDKVIFHLFFNFFRSFQQSDFPLIFPNSLGILTKLFLTKWVIPIFMQSYNFSFPISFLLFYPHWNSLFFLSSSFISLKTMYFKFLFSFPSSINTVLFIFISYLFSFYNCRPSFSSLFTCTFLCVFVFLPYLAIIFLS